MSTDGWIEKENVVYLYNGILPSQRKEGNTAICNNMDEPGRHYVQWNKPDTEDKYCMISLICGV